jgi:hypothetical protein
LFSFQAGYEKQDIRTLILSVCSLGGGGCASTIYVKSCGTNVKQTTQLVVAKQAAQGQAKQSGKTGLVGGICYFLKSTFKGKI